MFPKVARQFILDHFARPSSIGLIMHLVKVNPTPADDDLTISDLTECDYPGYAAQSVADPGASTIDGSNQATCTTATMTFEPSGMSTPQTIYGYWLALNTGSPNIWAWQRLTTPVVLSSDASKFIRQITLDLQTYNP